ncbi:MAG: amidohydrolase [Betaproteobacteria bacterium]|nr:amidohydrolase [Betaproteobacteria bacterium]
MKYYTSSVLPRLFQFGVRQPTSLPPRRLIALRRADRSPNRRLPMAKKSTAKKSTVKNLLPKRRPAGKLQRAPAVIRRRSTSTPVIDFHTHIVVDEVSTFVKQNRSPETTEYQMVDNYKRATAAERMRHPRPTRDELAARVMDMDELGIDKQLISCHVAEYCYWASPEDGAKMARIGNDAIAEFVARKPGRFMGMGTVPLQNTQAAVKEMDRAAGELGFRAIAINTHVEGMELGDEVLLPFWARAEQLSMPVYIHPAGFKHPRFTRHHMWNSVGQPIEEAIAMSNLIYEGILDRFPKLTLGIAHGGGFLPYYAGRVDRNFRYRPHLTPKISKEPSQYMRRFFYDTVVYNVDMLEFLARKIGPDRIVLGSDYPVGEENMVAFVKGAKLSSAAKQMILGGNAARLLGL